VGLLAHIQLWPEKLRAVCEEAKAGSNDEFCAIERRIIGIDHEQLGRGLAERWRFPQSCQQVAGSHHHPQPGNLLAGLVHIADTICCHLPDQGFNLTALNQHYEEAELKTLGLDNAGVDDVITKLPQKIIDGLAVFG